MIFTLRNYQTKEQYYYCTECGHAWTKSFDPANYIHEDIGCPNCPENIPEQEIVHLSQSDFFMTKTSVMEKNDVQLTRISDTAFSGKVRMFKVESCMNSEPHITCTCTSVREFDVSVSPAFSARLVMDGEEMKPTTTNIKKVLAFVSGYDLKETIFYRLSQIHSLSSMSKILVKLKTKPWIEKLYAAGDKDLYLYCLCKPRENELDKSRGDLAHLLRINRSLFHFLLNYSRKLLNNNFRIDMIWDMIERFGMQTTENILTSSINLGNEKDDYQSPVRCFIDLLMMPGVNFDYNRLVQYLNDDIDTYQGIDSVALGANLLHDYIDNCMEMGVSFEKYPRSLKLVHDISAKNLKIVLDEREREMFSYVINHNDYQSLCYQGPDYIIKAPTCPDDLVNEGAALSHCVGSYIRKVATEGVKILFMRAANEPEASLVTLDVRDHQLYQAAGFGNRVVTKEEREFIKKWCDYKNINCTF